MQKHNNWKRRLWQQRLHIMLIVRNRELLHKRLRQLRQLRVAIRYSHYISITITQCIRKCYCFIVLVFILFFLFLIFFNIKNFHPHQFNRRDSISSTSSGDSGTPIDGPYDESFQSNALYNKSYTVCHFNFFNFLFVKYHFIFFFHLLTNDSL